MNKANKIDARYSVAQAIQRNWQGYLHSLNKQQFFGIVRKGHYLYTIFSKSWVQEWCKKMLGRYCFSMEKLKAWIYIQWFWLQIVMVSPGTHLVKNIESQSRNNESQIKKYIYTSLQLKMLGPLCNWQLIWLISLTDSKTLYYCCALKLKYSPSKG